MNYALFEFVVLVVAIGVAGSWQHYTWWGCGILMLADLAEVVPITFIGQPTHNRVWTLLIVNSIYIQLAVLFMSGNRCTYFNDVRLELGDGVYVFGNFLVHYMPTLRAVSYISTNPDRFQTIQLDAALLSVIFCTMYNPQIQYGCDYVDRAVITAGSVLVPVLLEVGLVRYMQIRLKREIRGSAGRGLASGTANPIR
jgi:hypothetical protein